MARRKNISNKGMELPINTLVVVAIAVIVILAIAAFFMGGFGGSSKDIQNRQNFLNACSSWVQTGCAGDAPSDVELKFVIWQTYFAKEDNKEQFDETKLPSGYADKNVYLKQMCGCYGAGAPAPTGTGTKTGTTCKAAGGIGCYSATACTSGGGSAMSNNYECVSPQVCCKAGTSGWTYG